MRMRKLWVTALVSVATGLPTDVRAQGAETIEIPLRAEDGRLIVPVEASDGSQLQFVVGTTYTGLSETAAARLGDQPSLALGGVEVRLDDFPPFPAEGLMVSGRVMDGMVGSATLNQFDVLIDVVAILIDTIGLKDNRILAHHT